MTETGITFTSQQNKEGILIKDTAPGSCVMVIFGATGDLSRLKLFPALYGLAAEKKLPEQFEIIGYSHTDRTSESFIDQIRQSLEKKLGQAFDAAVWDWLAGRLRYVAGDFAGQDDYLHLAAVIKKIEEQQKTRGNRLFYLATASPFFGDILQNLHGAGLIHPVDDAHPQPWSRVVIEKPFGTDLESARQLNRLATGIFDEKQIFRVDHYMAKETVQNILVLRFANSIFEPLWNRSHIDHVQLTAAEDIGITTRGAFYDKTGVVRDVLQNHLMQVLALVAMELPVSLNPRDFHDEKSKFFRALRPLDADDLSEHAVLGQYIGYTEEKNVEPDSATPTFVALKVLIDNWRWQGVPFYIRAGKGLAAKLTEVSIHFRPIPICLFGGADACRRIHPNVLTIRIQPDEGITLSFACKVPGDHLEVGEVTMDFSYARAFAGRQRAAYERLLLDCMRGDNLLYGRADVIEGQWSFVAPLLEGEEGSAKIALQKYERGSDGPRTAEAIIAGDGRCWRGLAENCPNRENNGT
jgi:glucose-6-phosphate 1-dehydrogenase